MSKKLHFLSVQPDDLYYLWQILVQLHNFRKFGYDKLARVLIYLPEDRKPKGFLPLWKDVEKLFPDTKFFYYQDEDGISDISQKFGYIPLLRPYCLRRHFKEFPFLTNDAIFYHDSDILFTKELDFSPYLQDDINYLSDTVEYIGAAYFESKIKDVDPARINSYLRVDILKEAIGMFGLSKEIAVQNNMNSGGAQYLLKNITPKFWVDVTDGILMLLVFLANVNSKYFPGKTYQERENNGFQRWCSDMWSILWTLWKYGAKTECPKDLDFVWATDVIGELDKAYIYHDAGATKDREKELFYKRKQAYVDNEYTPFEDSLSYVSSEFCSKFYTQEIEETRKFLNSSEWPHKYGHVIKKKLEDLVSPFK
jgi:hypothetical protein